MPRGTSAPHLEVLDERRREVFAQLRQLPRAGVLGGGTAIALQLKHRRSYDFDVFYSHDIPRRWLPRLRRIFGNDLVRPILDTDDELTVLLRGEVKLSLIAYPFAPLHPVVRTPSIPLFDLRDLASSKAYTIGRRGEWRDYVDLYYVLLTHGRFTLRSVIREAERRFGGAFSASLFLQQLTYYGDLTDRSVGWIGRGPSTAAIERYFTRLVSRAIQ